MSCRDLVAVEVLVGDGDLDRLDEQRGSGANWPQEFSTKRSGGGISDQPIRFREGLDVLVDVDDAGLPPGSVLSC